MKTFSRTVLLLPSTTHVMKAEKALRKADIKCRLIPVPSHISSQCGVCVRIDNEDVQRARTALMGTNLQVNYHGEGI